MPRTVPSLTTQAVRQRLRELGPLRGTTGRSGGLVGRLPDRERRGPALPG